MYWLTGSYSGNDIDEDGAVVLPEHLEKPPFFDGYRVDKRWSAPFLQFSEGERYDVLNYRPGAIVFSEYAKEVFGPYMMGEVEFLPVLIENYRYYIVNVVNIVNCLDKSKSEFKYKSDGKTVRYVRHYEFDESLIGNAYLLKLPETASIEILATQKFKALSEKLNVKGLKCIPVW